MAVLVYMFVLLQTHFGQIQKADFGKIDLYENFSSQLVTPRNIEVWLPENYSAQKKYAVLYIHDGQMLFDPNISWNKQSWNVDSTATMLMRQGLVRDFIIVGIWNGGKTRYVDYFPQKAIEKLTSDQIAHLSRSLRNRAPGSVDFVPKSDLYLQFIVKEVKPFIDGKYSVYADKKNTFIAGSSMGGLISMYAITQYPEIFGGAACLSTHWSGIFEDEINNPVPGVFEKYLRENIGKLNGNKIYFDHGNQTLDALYPPFQKMIDGVLKNYPKHLWKSLFFEGKDHSENAWKERFSIPLLFLLKNME